MTRDARTSTPRALLTPAELHILLSFAEGPRHGYAVRKDVAERTDGRLSLGPGTLYEGIHRMVSRGWLAEAPEAAEGRRKAYRLTEEGAAEMREELARLERVVGWARRRKLLHDGPPLGAEGASS